jgi:hypothetical protein
MKYAHTNQSRAQDAIATYDHGGRDQLLQMVPADGTSAAVNWRGYGTPRWQLMDEIILF